MQRLNPPNSLLERSVQLLAERTLTSDTQDLCEEILADSGFHIANSFTEQHREACLYLRTHLTHYIKHITIVPSPIGAERWIEECMASKKTDQKTMQNLNETVGKDWDILDNKFPLSDKRAEFDVTKIIDYDGICSPDDNEYVRHMETPCTHNWILVHRPPKRTDPCAQTSKIHDHIFQLIPLRPWC